QSVELNKKLKEISEVYQIYVSYDVPALSGIQTDFQVNKKQSVTEALTALLDPLQIRYKAIDNKFYVLEKTSGKTQNRLENIGQWSFQLLDDTNLSPVSDAFIFGENSSIGTTTDQDGKATLSDRKLNKVKLVLTHINYETVTIPSEKLRRDTTNLVFMTPKVLDLREVTIGAKKRKNRKRKLWMREFENAFFGETNRKNKIELLNPEVLWFEETDSIFQAHATDYLSLINKSTGYKMRFFLDDFKIFNNQDVRYIGQIFFEDISADMRNQRRINKRRDKNYLNSKNLFFKSLVQELPINQKRFEFGITAPTNDPINPYHYEPINYTKLNWRYGLGADTILLTDYLTVINKDEVIANHLARGRNGKVMADKPAASFLLSRTGRFILNKNGYLINQKDIEESGYWTSHRMAMELPIDYKSPVTVDDENSRHRIIDSLNTYKYVKTPEKVFIHTNKSTYSNRENMWFKAYLVDGVDHRPQTQSKVIYVDLISPEDKIIKTWMIHKDQGFTGDFVWNRNFPAGDYRLRAYTNFMRNTDADFFYEKTITVYNFLLNQDAPSLQQKQLVPKPKLNAEMVRFFPEGGDLIAGLMANVSFSILDSLGRPYEVSGQLLDDQNNEITSLKTYHQGVGLFNFIPKPNVQYRARILHNGQSILAPLPKVYPAGWTLQVNPTSAEQIYVDVACTEPDQLAEAFLVGHVRGSIFCYIQNLVPGQSIQLSKPQIPEGILHFTLFDGQAQPQAERLVFNDALETPSLVNIGPASTAGPNSEVSIPLQLGEALQGEVIAASVSITNALLTQYDKYEEDIQSYLLLNSDLAEPILEPGQYLKQQDKTSRFYLDLLLMCRGWRRFNWKDLLDSESRPQLPFIPEEGYTIRGTTIAKGNPDKTVQAEVMLNSFDNNFIYKKLQTDKDGNFAFMQLPGMDTVQYILQGRINNGKTSKEGDGKLVGNRLVEFKLSTRPSIPVDEPRLYKLPTIPKFNKLQEEVLTEKTSTDEVANAPAWQIELDEVTIEAKRSYRNDRPTGAYFFDLDGIDWIAPDTRGPSLLARLTPRYTFYPGEQGKLYIQSPNWQGQTDIIPVVISIDGMGAEPGGSNAGPFLSLTADDIQNIVISPGYIGVTTRKIPRTREAYLESGILQYKHPAYDKARTFYTPSYSKDANQDMRTAVAWEPQLRFDQDGKTFISFKTANTPGVYRIHLEGISANGDPIVKKAQVNIQF
ncbi:MAG: hypothetical protein AAF705_03170, partial [Bacteroidota bacterium]